MSLIYHPQFGGKPINGSAAANVGEDCVVTIGGSNSIYAITQIIATYGLGNQRDYQRAGNADFFRSFAGRLIVFEGKTTESTARNLYLKYAENDVDIVFDTMLHSFETPHIFTFPVNEGVGTLRTRPGTPLTAVLYAGRGFDNTNTNVAVTISMLHVNAVRIAEEDTFRIGDVKARN